MFLELRHLWQLQAWPNCAHPVAKIPQIQHLRPKTKYVFTRVASEKDGSGAHAMLMGVAPCT